jgi:hypothetical protein
VKVEDPGEHSGLARIQSAPLGAPRDQQAQLLGRGLLLLLDWDTENPGDEEPCRRVRDRDQRPEEVPEELERPRDPQHQSLGAGYADQLRSLLSEDHVEQGDDAVREGERDRRGGTVAHWAVERRLDQVRNRGLAGKTKPDRCQRYPDLGGRDVVVHVVHLVGRKPSPFAPLLGKLLHPDAPGAHDRELRRDEEPVHRDEHEDEN